MAVAVATCFLLLFFLSSLLKGGQIEAAETLTINGQWTAINANGTIKISGDVPGGIYTDLVKNKIIDDPYYRFNDVNYRWVGKTTWNYSRIFSVPSEFINHKKINLICNGLDTIADIFINDVYIGSSENMFLRYIYDVKLVLNEGTNKIEVVFTSPVTYAEEKYEEVLYEKYAIPPICPVPVQNGECHPNFIRKIQSQFSWDWGPAFPSVGIWKDIGFEAFDSSALRDMTVSTFLEPNNIWRLDFRLFFDVVNEYGINGTLTILLESEELLKKEVNITPDENFIFQTNISVSVPQEFKVEQWWPNGLGKQQLYNITAIFSPHDASEETSKSVRIGFRTVELIQDPIPNAKGLTFYFKINGVKTFMKGSNWIPADSFPERITPEYTKYLLQSAKEANMNVLRVWGGGMYETDVFYEYADELGIMIWQDMMFACSMYPATGSFLDNVHKEISHQVKRLQHHPSILLWSGNNENEAALVQNWYGTLSKDSAYRKDYLKLYKETIQPLVTQLDPNRPYILSSPSNGIETEKEGGIAKDPSSSLYGDVHFYDYSNNAWDWTIYPIPRFISEYGIQSWTSFETLSKVSIPEDWSLTSKFVDHRQHHMFGNDELISSIKLHFGVSETCNDINGCGNKQQQFSDFIYLTQIAQAMGIKTASEHYLRQQSQLTGDRGLTMGALYWQLNDIWQCPSWASIEFGGKWKMLHYYAKNFFAPAIVSLYEDDENLMVSVVSDSSVHPSHYVFDLYIYHWDNLNPYHVFNRTFYQESQTANIILETNMTALIDDASCPGRETCFLYATVSDVNSSKVLYSNFYFLTSFQAAETLQNTNISVSIESGSCQSSKSECTFNLKLKSSAIAPFVWLETQGIPGHFSDNGFLLVSSERNLQFYSLEIISATQLEEKLTVMSLIDVFNREGRYPA